MNKLTDNVQPLDLIVTVNELVEEVNSAPINLSDLVDDTATTPVNKATTAIKLGSSDVGDATQPVYLDNGEPIACTHTLAKSVPSDAIFTDTTYSSFTGADGTDAGTSGLVPAPSATDNNKYLKGDGTWATISGSGGADIDLSNLSATGESHFQSPLGFTPENQANKVTSISSSSTDIQYPSAKTTYDMILKYNLIQDINTLSSGTIALNYVNSLHKRAVTANTTFTFDTSNLSLTSSVTYTFELLITMSTVKTLTFPNSVTWQGGTTPTMSQTGTYYFVFRTVDAGTTWHGNLEGRW